MFISVSVVVFLNTSFPRKIPHNSKEVSLLHRTRSLHWCLKNVCVTPIHISCCWSSYTLPTGALYLGSNWRRSYDLLLFGMLLKDKLSCKGIYWFPWLVKQRV